MPPFGDGFKADGDMLPVPVCHGGFAVNGMNLGSDMIQKAEEIVREKGGKSISLHAQCRVRAFYEKLGFCGYGVEDEDEGCPHCWMKKQLSL